MVLVPGEKRKKWDRNSVKMTFVGYDPETKGYRCIDTQTRKLIISRDVKFLEVNSVTHMFDEVRTPESMQFIGEPEVMQSSTLEDIDRFRSRFR